MQKLTVCVLFSKSWYPCGKMGTHRQTAYTGTFCEVCFCYSVSFLRGNVQTIKGSPHTNKQANQHTNNKTKHYGNIDQYENMSLQDEKHKKPINMQNLEKKNCTNTGPSMQLAMMKHTHTLLASRTYTQNMQYCKIIVGTH